MTAASPSTEATGESVDQQGLRGFNSDESIRDVLAQRVCAAAVGAATAGDLSRDDAHLSSELQNRSPLDKYLAAEVQDYERACLLTEAWLAKTILGRRQLRRSNPQVLL